MQNLMSINKELVENSSKSCTIDGYLSTRNLLPYHDYHVDEISNVLNGSSKLQIDHARVARSYVKIIGCDILTHVQISHKNHPEPYLTWAQSRATGL